MQIKTFIIFILFALNIRSNNVILIIQFIKAKSWAKDEEKREKIKTGKRLLNVLFAIYIVILKFLNKFYAGSNKNET